MKIILLLITLFLSANSISQVSDFMVLKKNQHTLQSYFAGSHIAFETSAGYYEGQINSIAKDSVYLTEFDIRQFPTQLGVMVWDTVAAYKLVFNYKEIIEIGNQKKKNFSWASSGGSLLGGGILITAVGLGTWIFTKPGTQYYASPIVVGGGALLAGIGYLLIRSNSNQLLGKKYHLDYIKVKG